MSDFVCEESNDSVTWGFIDLMIWKIVPERFSGGKVYIQKFKDAWVRHNKAIIKKAAEKYNIPKELLAGVCWIEVGGDPNVMDRVAFEVRSFDWSGSDWIDRHLTVTNNPRKTSFGWVSIQLRAAAQTLGVNPSKLSMEQYSILASCLEKDVFNIDVVAHHLRQLIEHDGFQNNLPTLSMDEVRVVGARYNRGTGLSLDNIKKNTSYGDFIVKFWSSYIDLLK